MYVLYVDETENSQGGRSAPALFGLAGLMVTARYISSFEERIEAIRAEFGVPEDWEIHGYEIFSGSGRWAVLLNREQRCRLCERIVEEVAGSGYVKAGFFVSTPSTPSIKDDYLGCLRLTVEKAASVVAKQGTSKQLMVVFDEKGEIGRQINKTIRDARAGVLKQLKRTCGRTCRVIDGGYAGRSDMSTLLQIADLVGYIIRSRRTLAPTADPRHKAWLDGLVTRLGKKVKQHGVAPVVAQATT